MRLCVFSGFKLALISKGLRPARAASVLLVVVFQACPDFKGIKTGLRAGLRTMPSFKLALISKGLRPLLASANAEAASFKLALISKGLRPDCGLIYGLDSVSSLP